MFVVHKWKYSFVFMFWDLIAFTETNHTKDYPYSDLDYILTTTEDFFKAETNLESGERKFVIEDENTAVKIILVGGAQLRTALRNEEKIWKNGTIPYVIDRNFKKEHKDLILKSIDEFHNKTCIRFTPRKDEVSYIVIMPGSGCSAGLGRGPKVNTVKLHAGCFAKGIVIHELMHALGFIHEQNRPDRDDFIRIDFDNVIERYKLNFKKFSVNQVSAFNLSYDYESVMHYGAFDFSKNRSKPTIITLQRGVRIGQRTGFSEKDLIKINLLYNCGNRNNTEGRKQGNEGTTGAENKEKSDEKNKKLKRFRFFYMLSRLLS